MQKQKASSTELKYQNYSGENEILTCWSANEKIMYQHKYKLTSSYDNISTDN